MVYQLLAFSFSALGLYLILTARCPSIYRPAARALKVRAPKALSQTEVMVNSLAERLKGHIDMEPMKRAQVAEMLKSLGRPESPESFQAHALARALLQSLVFIWTLVLSPYIGLAFMVLIGIMTYRGQVKKLQGEMLKRRQLIEHELPRFASTIRQNLKTTRNVTEILQTYGSVCGPALKREIDRTLNDMMTGNHERALRALESRVASPQLGQVTRGLIAVLRGDDQIIYFDILAGQFQKSQNEEVAKSLEKRPDKLNPYMAILFACLFLILAAAVGGASINQLNLIYG